MHFATLLPRLISPCLPSSSSSPQASSSSLSLPWLLLAGCRRRGSLEAAMGEMEMMMIMRLDEIEKGS